MEKGKENRAYEMTENGACDKTETGAYKMTDNSAYDMTENEEEEDAELASIDMHNARRKVMRHNTDVFTSKRRLSEDVIIEDDYTRDERETAVIRKSPKKKTVLVTRHNTEVLRKRPPSGATLTPARELEDIQVTRRSVSRQGSHVQQGSRMLVTDEAETSTKSILKSQTQDKTARKHMKIMINAAYRQIQQHKDQANFHKLKRKTKSFSYALDRAQHHNIAILIGKPGIGKTFTALSVVDALLEENEDFKPIFVKSPFQFEYLFNASTPMIVLADDFLGPYGYDDSYLYGWNRWAMYLTQLLKKKRLFLILTAENECIDKITDTFTSLLSLVESDFLVDLESEECQMTNKARTKLLSVYLHAHKKSLTSEEVKTIVESENDVLGFPLVTQLCVIFDPKMMSLDHYANLCKHIAKMRTHMFSRYFVLVLMLVFDGKFSMSGPTPDQQSEFEKLTDAFQPQSCSFAELTLASDHLTNSYITFDNSSRCFRFSHNVVHTAVFHDFVQEYSVSAIELLPLEVVSSISSNADAKHTENTYNTLDTSTRLKMNVTVKQFKIIATRFKAALELKKTITAMRVASSRLWKNDSFTEIALAIFGTQFFFHEDEAGVPLTAYFAKTGNIEILVKLTDFISKYREDEIKKYHKQLLKTAEEACRKGHGEVIESILGLLPTIDDSVICAAAEEGNLPSLEILVKHGGQIFQRRAKLYKWRVNTHILTSSNTFVINSIRKLSTH